NLGRIPVLPQEPEGRALRALGSRGRLPPMVQCRPRHADQQISRRLQTRRAKAGRERMTRCRLTAGGLIDRARPLDFTVAGRRYQGYSGDTLASALMANGVRLVGRSFKYHRPRGLMAAGMEEPNALVQLETGAQTTANVRATEVELYEGLAASPVNAWP